MKTIVISLLLLVGLSGTASARQYVAWQGGRQRVVHTRILPVIFHRVLPPYTGIHLHESEIRWR